LGDLSVKKGFVGGGSYIVGKRMAALLLKESCTVSIADYRTINLKEECRPADILVAAVGRPELIKGDWIKPGATIIDVGINRIEKEEGGTKLVGDVEFSSANEVAEAMTPVPGGVGPMTIACLLHNALQQACRINNVDVPD
jgi:methylenetetrahydrofolate dehydrogenase (NADP+)/methenyltetrahydrofolate cyclohydrolase